MTTTIVDCPRYPAALVGGIVNQTNLIIPVLGQAADTLRCIVTSIPIVGGGHTHTLAVPTFSFAANLGVGDQFEWFTFPKNVTGMTGSGTTMFTVGAPPGGQVCHDSRISMWDPSTFVLASRGTDPLFGHNFIATVNGGMFTIVTNE